MQGIEEVTQKCQELVSGIDIARRILFTYAREDIHVVHRNSSRASILSMRLCPPRVQNGVEYGVHETGGMSPSRVT